jgi:hypothetical protein
MAKRKDENPQRSLFEDNKTDVHKRRANQKNLKDIYMDDMDLSDQLPPEYRDPHIKDKV